MLNAAVGFSHARNPQKAINEALKMAKSKQDFHKISFAIIHANCGYDFEFLNEILSTELSEVPYVGCSSAGIITHELANESNFGLIITLIESDELIFTPYFYEDIREDQYAVGKNLGQTLTNNKNAELLILFPEGLECNFDLIKQGIEENFTAKKTLPIFGGLSADNFSMKETFQFTNNKITNQGLVGYSIGGCFNYLWEVNHGSIPIGRKREVTKCDKNKIYEIDNIPVLEVLKEYLSEEEIDNWGKSILNLSFGFQINNEDKKDYDDFKIRFIPSKNEEDNSVLISTEVSEGEKLWMTRRSLNKLEDGIERVITNIHEKINKQKPKLIFQFDCGGRGKLFMSEDDKYKLLNKLHQGIDKECPWSGFYTFGEIAPIGENNNFHNYTVVLLVIY